jgi:single-strand DNA-binding protein
MSQLLLVLPKVGHLLITKRRTKVIGLNKVFVMGNVGADPETRGEENTVSTFRVATNSQSKQENGEKITHTEWHNIVCFGNLAGIVQQYIRKGRPVLVEGRLQTRKYEKDGEPTKYYTEIVANNVQFLDSKPSAE